MVVINAQDSEPADFLDLATFKTVVNSTPLVSIDLCLVVQGQLLMGLRKNEPLKGRWFTPGGRLLKNERWQDGLKRIASNELRLEVEVCDFNLMGIWDHFYSNSALDESVSTHYVNLPHVCHLSSLPEIFLEDQHSSVRWFNIVSIINDTRQHIYMREYAKWIHDNISLGVNR